MDEAVVLDPEMSSLVEVEGKYLTFDLAGERYGIGILTVREIMGIVEIRSVPKTPSFMKGVINLRGKVIPVVDLRSRFDMEEREYDQETCIIVVWAGKKDGARVQMGIIVDSVDEVRAFMSGDIEPPPSLGAGVDTQFILGMGKNNDKVYILLDINRVISDEEFSVLEKVN